MNSFEDAEASELGALLPSGGACPSGMTQNNYGQCVNSLAVPMPVFGRDTRRGVQQVKRQDARADWYRAHPNYNMQHQAYQSCQAARHNAEMACRGQAVTLPGNDVPDFYSGGSDLPAGLIGLGHGGGGHHPGGGGGSRGGQSFVYPAAVIEPVYVDPYNIVSVPDVFEDSQPQMAASSATPAQEKKRWRRKVPALLTGEPVTADEITLGNAGFKQGGIMGLGIDWSSQINAINTARKTGYTAPAPVAPGAATPAKTDDKSKDKDKKEEKPASGGLFSGRNLAIAGAVVLVGLGVWMYLRKRGK